MTREVSITDTTLRDGHQSLWAGRMSTKWMVPVAQRLERSGVSVVDVIGQAHFITAVRFLREDPWKRLQMLRQTLSRPLLSASAGGQLAGKLDIAPDDISELFVECVVRSGVELIRGFHGLIDAELMVQNLRVAKGLGAKTVFPVIYSVSPYHTDQFFENRTREVVGRVEVDYIMIKDPGGLLTPERTGPLVDAIRRAAGGAEVTLHSHCTTGLAERVYMVGVQHGVNDVQCGIWPLAQGTAQPSVQTMVRNLRAEGYTVDIDDSEISSASDYLLELAKRINLPVGAPQEYDHRNFKQQLPGGMISILKGQLIDSNLLDRLPEILEETSVVREELGWPTMVTPFSQFVVNQALLNILGEERYRTVPDEIKMYALGYWGRPIGPIDPNVMDRIMKNGSRDLEKGLEEIRQPIVPALRRRYPSASDEELVLRYMCSESDMGEMLKRRNEDRDTLIGSELDPNRLSVRLNSILGEIAALTDVARVTIESGDIHLSVVR